MKELLERVLNHLKTRGFIDNEDVAYFSQEHPFTAEEYDQIHSFLEQQVSDVWTNELYDYSTCFEEKQIFFEYNDFKFVWRVLVGQGTALQLISADNYTKTFEEEKKKIITL